MTFSQKFDDFVCESDSIICEVDGYTITARITHDETPDAPDDRQDEFWPSLYLNHAGFIGAGNGCRDRFDKAQAKAERVMAAWKNDEWYYCGVILSVAINGITLDDHATSLWGIEANYPDIDNAYLTEVANELLPECSPENLIGLSEGVASCASDFYRGCIKRDADCAARIE